MKICVSCWESKKIIYRGMCQECTRDFRYSRYRGWIERKAMKLGRRIPNEGPRRKLKAELRICSNQGEWKYGNRNT